MLLHVSEKELLQYQLMWYKDHKYCLTRLSFELNSAPKIKVTVLKSILGKVNRIRRVTNSCIEDILIDKTVMCATEVISHLEKFRLTVKPPIAMIGRTALGLEHSTDKTDTLVFQEWGSEIGIEYQHQWRRTIFSVWETTGSLPNCREAMNNMQLHQERDEQRWGDKVREGMLVMMWRSQEQKTQ